jgi:hypothetical protein
VWAQLTIQQLQCCPRCEAGPKHGVRALQMRSDLAKMRDSRTYDAQASA